MSSLVCSKLFTPSSPPLSSPQGWSSETNGWGGVCLSVCSPASPSSGIDFLVSLRVWWFSVSEGVLLTPGSRVAMKWDSLIKKKKFKRARDFKRTVFIWNLMTFRRGIHDILCAFSLYWCVVGRILAHQRATFSGVFHPLLFTSCVSAEGQRSSIPAHQLLPHPPIPFKVEGQTAHEYITATSYVARWLNHWELRNC